MAETAARSSVLRLRGLPFTATEADLGEFFSGFELVATHICRRNGRATGEAYVQFTSEVEAGTALQTRNLQMLGPRYIECFEALESDLGAAKGAADIKLKGWVLKMRGLPFSATPADVVSFFGDVELVRGADGVVFTVSPDGRPTGEAWVEFPNEDAQKEALKLHKAKMGQRYIELFPSSKGDMFQAIQQQGQHGRGLDHRGRSGYLEQGPPPPPPARVDGTTLKLRGLPFSAGVDDVTEFFAGFSLADEGVQLLSKTDRTGAVSGTGVAYVQFKDAEEAERARSSQHRKTIGSRYIECLPYTPGRHASGSGFGQYGPQSGPVGGPKQHTPPPLRPPLVHQPFDPASGHPIRPLGKGAPIPGAPGQPIMSPHDYNAQQMMMQQHYLMQQHMMQQQQAMRGYDPSGGWGGYGGAQMGSPQGTPAPVAGHWYKGAFGAPGAAGPPGPQGVAPGVLPYSQAPGYAYAPGSYSAGGSGQQGGMRPRSAPRATAAAPSALPAAEDGGHADTATAEAS